VNAACASVLSLEPQLPANVHRSHQGRTAMPIATKRGDSRHLRARATTRKPDGKEGVDGSSPSEGFEFLPA
jgi:hypothetical protein